MLPELRQAFNRDYRPERYQALLADCARQARAPLEFRIAETPCFFPHALMQQIADTGAELTHQLLGNAAFLKASEEAVPERFRVPHCPAHPHFMTADFGLVREDDGSLAPRLVELQAFPSIFGFQAVLFESYARTFHLPGNLDRFLSGHDDASYWALLRKVIVGNHAPENVVLLEIEPEAQKTLPDFHVHEDRLGIRTVDIAKLKREGRRLFYRRGDRDILIERIYNRAIVDELERKGVALPFDYRDDLDVEWAGHPNWYFRISKFAIPWLHHPAVPAAVFLNDWYDGKDRDLLPEDREQWVFKPLYSFAGKGVQFGPPDAELSAIPAVQRHNFLLQQRVRFEPVIDTPHGLTQAEVRIMYVWPDGETLQPVINLIRMGRGKMMGVDHNRNQEWVGASAGFCPKKDDMQNDTNHAQPLIFCLSTYVKGQPFMRECARLGCRVELLTLDKHRDADWPRDVLSQIHTMPEDMTSWQVVNTVMYLARSRKIDRIVALDEFDMEIAATLREHMRLPGMGESATRFFRDKLSMRVRAREAGLLVPDFIGVFNHDDLHHWMQQTPSPWMLKPRTDASAIGIRKLHKPEELWPLLDELGDRQSHHLLERFIPGDIFHADGVVWGGHTLTAPVHQYGKPPFQLMHHGGVFTTRTVDRASIPAKEIPQLHEKLMAALGLANGVTHTEWIRAGADGRFYFLEAAARVGGAFIADVIEQANGFNPWVEWARIEVALAGGEQYSLPKLGTDYAGSVLCLARDAEPVTDHYDAPEIVHRMQKRQHAGLIVRSSDPARVQQLTEEYARRFAEDFLAIAPAPAKATA